MGATYILYVDYYVVSCQWNRAKITYFTDPNEIPDWMLRNGFVEQQAWGIWRGYGVERYIIAIARAAPILTTMTYHVDRMLRSGGDDFAISMAYQCEKDVKRWAERAKCRGTAARAENAQGTECRGTADSAWRLECPPCALESGALAEGAGRWVD